MTKILIIDGHPDPDPARFVHALASAYAAAAREAGHDVQTIEVASACIDVLRSGKEWENGDPSAAVKQAQEQLTWAEHVVILFPLWLGAMPGLLKDSSSRYSGPASRSARASAVFPRGCSRENPRASWSRWACRLFSIVCISARTACAA